MPRKRAETKYENNKNTGYNKTRNNKKMKPIELQVLWHTDTTTALESASIDYDLTDLDTRLVLFFNIDCVMPYEWEKDIEFCRVHSGGEKFICPMTYEEMVKKLIDGQA